MGIIGDIVLSPSAVVAAGRTLPLTVAADVPAFVAAGRTQPARILRVTTPTDPVMLNGNHLCGAPVRWIAAYRGSRGKELNLALFSGAPSQTGRQNNQALDRELSNSD